MIELGPMRALYRVARALGIAHWPAVVGPATMPADMTDWQDTGYARGRRARAAILAELRRGEDAGEDAPTLRELAAAVGLSQTATHHHLVVLRKARLVSVDVEHGGGVELTRAGRRKVEPHSPI